MHRLPVFPPSADAFFVVLQGKVRPRTFRSFLSVIRLGNLGKEFLDLRVSD